MEGERRWSRENADLVIGLPLLWAAIILIVFFGWLQGRL